MKLSVKALTASLLISLLLSPGANARRRTLVPPGNSAVSEYVESIPTANGGRPTVTVNPGGAPARSGVISSAAQRAFGLQGAEGRSAAALANATAPRGQRAGHPSSSPPAASGESGGGPLGTLAKTLAGASTQGGLGLLLPVTLIVIALGGGALALWRRRAT